METAGTMWHAAPALSLTSRRLIGSGVGAPTNTHMVRPDGCPCRTSKQRQHLTRCTALASLNSTFTLRGRSLLIQFQPPTGASWHQLPPAASITYVAPLLSGAALPALRALLVMCKPLRHRCGAALCCGIHACVEAILPQQGVSIGVVDGHRGACARPDRIACADECFKHTAQGGRGGKERRTGVGVSRVVQKWQQAGPHAQLCSHAVALMAGGKRSIV